MVANIRGGGEYGPALAHPGAAGEPATSVFEDFAAVAHDLVARGHHHAGAARRIQGGSNGGLLMGVMLTRYPELFGAIVCQVPLLDMKRYHLLLAGASWMAEYGDPDNPDDWEFLSEYSPYQNADADATYPPILSPPPPATTASIPGTPARWSRALEEQGHDVWYYENIEGGHGGAADNAQAAFKSALTFTFLTDTLTWY